MMFAQRIVAGLRKTYLPTDREKRSRLASIRGRSGQKVDIVAEQVKKVLATSDQKLILMVRG